METRKNGYSLIEYLKKEIERTLEQNEQLYKKRIELEKKLIKLEGQVIQQQRIGNVIKVDFTNGASNNVNAY